LYFVFEIGPNGTLDDLIKLLKDKITEEIIKILFAQLINVQEFLMQKGIMHRDLKPQNIMLDENYNVKVIDFGDARKINEALDDEDEGDNAGRRDTFVGTVNYQSPEVINSEPQGHPLDIWALGCILFKLFVGTVPFKGTNPMLVYKDIKNRNI
jgi:3-phosphoinositide dependent protein kinase-1